MKKKVLISTGGTGGHVVPSIIFYEHLKKEYDTYLACDKRGIKYIDKKKYNFKIIDVPKISKNFIIWPLVLTKFIFSIINSFFYIKEKKIQILISTGGYMSLPVCIAAKILKCKIFLFEPNMVIGRSNLIFLKICTKIFCYSEKIVNFPKKFENKIQILPPLLREDIYLKERKNKFKFENKINFLIIGGSQGSDYFQNNLKNCILTLSKKYNIFVYHQVNEKNFQQLQSFYNENKINCDLFDFKNSMTQIISDSDICISRSGASSLAELVHLNIPFITVPFPYSKDNHQLYNAIFYKQKNCCWMIEQKNIKKNELLDLIVNILSNENDVKLKMSQMKKISYQNTWNNINQKLLKYFNEN